MIEQISPVWRGICFCGGLFIIVGLIVAFFGYCALVLGGRDDKRAGRDEVDYNSEQ